MKTKIGKIMGVFVIMMGVFVSGVYASENWKMFQGDSTTTKSNVSEIMSILDKVSKGKLSSEDAILVSTKERRGKKINPMEVLK